MAGQRLSVEGRQKVQFHLLQGPYLLVSRDCDFIYPTWHSVTVTCGIMCSQTATVENKELQHVLNCLEAARSPSFCRGRTHASRRLLSILPVPASTLRFYRSRRYITSLSMILGFDVFRNFRMRSCVLL